MSDISLGEALAVARRRAGLTQQALAIRVGTSQPAIARLERGQGSPTLATLERIAAAVGCDLKLELAPKPTTDQVTEAYKRDVDRTLLRENLKKSVDRRLRDMDAFRESAAELRHAMQRVRK